MTPAGTVRVGVVCCLKDLYGRDELDKAPVTTVRVPWRDDGHGDRLVRRLASDPQCADPRVSEPSGGRKAL